ncbi:NAD(P)-dependent oxidoreductase [Deinococcus depolymerans]|uniref:SDR family oxidoreductase n=1 Tax=Deinococcus depolymerans TaxID=392408 RepID=A0ABN1BNB2_9DEIO
MLRLLVTGGSGFVGSNLLDKLAMRAEYQLISADISMPLQEVSGVEYIKWDIRESYLDADKLGPIDCIIHLAALCKEPGYAWDEYFLTNHVGTKNVVDLAKKAGCKKIIFTSTMMVFKSENKPKYEASHLNPDTAYGISKALAEIEIKKWSDSQDGSYYILRPGVIYGNGDQGNFSTMISQIKKGRFAYIGRSSTIKSTIYLEQCTDIICEIIQIPQRNRIYHLVYPEGTSIADLTHQISKTFGFAPVRIVIPFGIALIMGYVGEFLSSIGLKNKLHHRRIEKLYYDTDIRSVNLASDGITCTWGLDDAISDLKNKEKI